MADTRGLEEKPGDRTISATAGADLTLHLLYMLTAGTNAQVSLAGATGYDSGTPNVAAKSGEPVTLRCNGILIVTAGEALATVGTPVQAAANGKVVTATVGTHHVIGFTRTVAGADGDLISISKL